MYICYVEESGDSGVFNPSDPFSNPFFIVIGLFIDRSRLHGVVHDFIRIKTKFFPAVCNAASHFLDRINIEIKGATIRKGIRRSHSHNRRIHLISFLDACLNLLQHNNVHLLGKVLIKNAFMSNSDAGFYGRSIMHICEHFDHFLQGEDDIGIIIADSRKVAQNKRVSHTVFTQQHQVGGSSYPHIIEIPTYGHSDNFAMLQLADIMCSAIIFPMIIDTFNAHITAGSNVHLSPNFSIIRARYKNRIMRSQYMYQNSQGQYIGGLREAP